MPKTSSPKPNNQASPGSIGNTVGLITPQPDPNGAIVDGQPTAPTDPPATPETPTQTSFWGKISGAVHTGLDVLGFVPGLGAIPDLANAGLYALEGDMLSAGVSAVAAVPFGGDAVKAGTMIAKGGKAVARQAAEKAAKEAEQALAKAAKEAEEAAAKAAREAQEAAAKARKEAADGGGKPPKREDGGHVRKQKPHKDCGKVSKYKNAPKKLGELNADHIPSGAALKEAATRKLKEMGVWDELSAKAKESVLNSVYSNAPTITVPQDVHKEGRTYGSKNKPLFKDDSKDLKGAFEKDAAAIQKSMDMKDHGCSEAYAKGVEELRKFDYQKYVEEAVKAHKAVSGKP